MNVIIDDIKLTNIADSLRNKLNTDEEFTPDDMADAIDDELKNVTGPYITIEKSEGSTKYDTCVYRNYENGVDKFSYDNVVVEDGITTINKGAFSSSKIKKVSLPDSITTIGANAFSTNNLEEFIIPPNVTRISEGMLSMTQINKLTIHDNITSIGQNAFSNTQLKNIFIPSSVTEILASSGTSGPFNSCNTTLHIYTPYNTRPSGWSQYFNNYTTTQKLTVHYGVSREEYEEIIESEDA